MRAAARTARVAGTLPATQERRGRREGRNRVIGRMCRMDSSAGKHGANARLRTILGARSHRRCDGNGAPSAPARIRDAVSSAFHRLLRRAHHGQARWSGAYLPRAGVRAAHVARHLFGGGPPAAAQAARERPLDEADAGAHRGRGDARRGAALAAGGVGLSAHARQARLPAVRRAAAHHAAARRARASCCS